MCVCKCIYEPVCAHVCLQVCMSMCGYVYITEKLCKKKLYLKKSSNNVKVTHGNYSIIPHNADIHSKMWNTHCDLLDSDIVTHRQKQAETL